MNKITDGSASFIVRKIGGGWTTNQRYHYGI